MEYIGALVILTIVCILFYLIYLLVETNQIAKRNYEKLDYVIKLLEKKGMNTSETGSNASSETNTGINSETNADIKSN